MAICATMRRDPFFFDGRSLGKHERRPRRRTFQFNFNHYAIDDLLIAEAFVVGQGVRAKAYVIAQVTMGFSIFDVTCRAHDSYIIQFPIRESVFRIPSGARLKQNRGTEKDARRKLEYEGVPLQHEI